MKKFLKKVGYSLLGLIAILLFISFLLPRDHHIESTITVNAPMSIVFDQVNDLRNWESWSPWKTMDPSMEMSFSNPPSGKGAFFHWQSSNPRIGNGKLTLMEVVPNQKIVTAMDFEDAQDGVAEFTFEEEKGKVKVKWGMTHHVGGNPFSKYGAIFHKGALRSVFDRGLIKIKANSETR